MKNNRSNKTIKNFAYGVGSQLMQTIFPFITRTIFIYTLGASFLGISSLFTSILSVLSLAELGIGNVVVYSLYKPLAEKNNKKIAALVSFYKKVYLFIAVVVFLLGILLVPFLQYLVNLPEGIEYIKLYYLLYVGNASLSYLFVYKSSIINADQKQYIVSTYGTAATILMNIFQSITLVIFKNFLFYLILQILFTFLQNLALSNKANKMYDLYNLKEYELSKEEKRQIFSDTKAMLAYKIGGTFLNTTDSVFISTLINTIAVGFYTNYTILEGILNKFIALVYNALFASIGNLTATETVEKQKSIFDVINLIFLWIGTVGFVGFFTTASEVISIWLGKKYLIDDVSVLALTFRFYMPIILYPVWMYRNTTGLFKDTQNILIYAGILNVILSWVFGIKYGLAGIIFASCIARLLTSFWYEPVVLYKKKFMKANVWEYFGKIIVSMGIALFSVVVMKAISINNIFLRLIIKIILSVLIPSLVLFILSFKSREFLYLKNMAIEKLDVLKRRRDK